MNLTRMSLLTKISMFLYRNGSEICGLDCDRYGQVCRPDLFYNHKEKIILELFERS